MFMGLNHVLSCCISTCNGVEVVSFGIEFLFRVLVLLALREDQPAGDNNDGVQPQAETTDNTAEQDQPRPPRSLFGALFTLVFAFVSSIIPRQPQQA